jgi:hypothetical protein
MRRLAITPIKGPPLQIGTDQTFDAFVSDFQSLGHVIARNPNRLVRWEHMVSIDDLGEVDPLPPDQQFRPIASILGTFNGLPQS